MQDLSVILTGKSNRKENIIREVLVMKLGIMQPYFFPYIGYWQLINMVDKYIIFDDVNYIINGWINRNRILMNGKEIMINLRIQKASPNKLINETNLVIDPIYTQKLLKTLTQCYAKAPYFNDVFPLLENILNQKEENLAEYLKFLILKICEYLNISTNIVTSSLLCNNKNLKGQDKIIDICKLVGANEYINSIGGTSLYSFDEFSRNGIKLSFLKPGDISYKQFNHAFIPNLSIIDVLMFNPVHAIREFLNNYELINEENVNYDIQ